MNGEDLELENAELRGRVAALEKMNEVLLAMLRAAQSWPTPTVVAPIPVVPAPVFNPYFQTMPLTPCQAAGRCCEYPMPWNGIQMPPCKHCGVALPQTTVVRAEYGVTGYVAGSHEVSVVPKGGNIGGPPGTPSNSGLPFGQ